MRFRPRRPTGGGRCGASHRCKRPARHGLSIHQRRAFSAGGHGNGGKAANQKLAAAGAGFLEQHHAAYLVDIHTMPAVARVFALPKLRKYPHRIVLVDTADALAAFPAQPGRVTVLALTPARRIQKISYWDPAREPVAGFLE